MPRTSPPRPLDLPALFPGLDAHARGATRLHPRPGTPDPAGSHLGGSLRWPTDEPWPTCVGPHRTEVREALTEAEAHRLRTVRGALFQAGLDRNVGSIGIGGGEAGPHLIYDVRLPAAVPTPMVAVAQLYAADLPDLPCPTGTDLLQVLWCPRAHDTEADQWGPRVELRWRATADLAGAALLRPEVAEADESYLVRPCVLHPEQVRDYPYWQELPPELGQRVREHDDTRDDGGPSYWSVSQATGWKVGGLPQWGVSDPDPMACPDCARPMPLVLTIASCEFEGTAWRPLEEADLVPSWTDPRWRDAERPTGIGLGGGAASLRVFVCPDCAGHPMRTNMH
ncbi:hypothetical protein [Catellatospora tritici]|uniref:hypothetical protein n=1 Tax=Catellatospora tritici TaxID=2851566 RepID=UPI001C2DC06F|nr:hypothetical protein [Catellatospora tritici]MBV1855929.1 hypothetical protein [Catellatospora tritici]